MKVSFLLPILLFVFCGCQKTNDVNTTATVTLKEIIVPCKEGGQPNLFVSETKQVYLSWVEHLNDTTDALLFSKLENGNWTPPHTIASGSDWFVNWADFPSLVSYKDNGQSLAAHWLQKSAAGTYDYDVHITQSTDGGKNWFPSFIPHQTDIAAEHGFVSMLPISQDKIFTTWLDGRFTKGHHDMWQHNHQEAMTLRAATFDREGKLYDEVELDERICDCCQTSVAMTNEGIVVAYRDRSENEIRDIAIVRQLDGKWTKPMIVFKDNWHIAGCPVNGPSIKATGDTLAIAWFSMPQEKPVVQIAFSNDGGTNFLAPIQVDEGNPMGRVGVAWLSGHQALVSWLEQTDTEAVIKIARVDQKGKIGDNYMVSATSVSRQSGFPVIAVQNEQIIIAWTEADTITKVKTAIMNIK